MNLPDPTPSDHAEPLDYAGIIFSQEKVAEDRGTSVERHRIRHMRLRYGFRARHPLLLAVFGVLVSAIGVAAVGHLLFWLLLGGTLFDVEVPATLLTLLGSWMLYQAIQRGWILDVSTDTGLQRLEFHKSAKKEELQDFLEMVNRELGYSVEQ
jgi:hypothetical protein